MVEIYPQPVVNILQAIHHGDLTCDINEFRKMVLEVVSRNLRLDRSLFILADESAQFSNFMVRNIDDFWVRRYKQYYHQHDPFELFAGTYRKKQFLRLDEVVELSSFFKSEYYNDFLSPQQVYHKITAHLIAGERTMGVFGFFRSKKSPAFSPEEIQMMTTIVPFISHALRHIETHVRQTVQNAILDIVGTNHAYGLLIFDTALNLLFMNENARNLCVEQPKDRLSRQTGLAPAPYCLGGFFDHCVAVAHEYQTCAGLIPAGHDFRPVLGEPDGRRYVLSAKKVQPRGFPEKYCLYAVTIDTLRDPYDLAWERCRQLYDLSRRQVDILVLLYRGCTNAQIGRELSICEITVKKHLQNIFEKVGVRNRTALMHRLLDSACSLN